MRAITKAALLGLAIAATGATGALAGKSTTPNPVAPSTLGAADIAALNRSLERLGVDFRALSVTVDGTGFIVTTTTGASFSLSSRAIAVILAGYT